MGHSFPEPRPAVFLMSTVHYLANIFNLHFAKLSSITSLAHTCNQIISCKFSQPQLLKHVNGTFYWSLLFNFFLQFFFVRSFIRALVKNFSMTFLFPVFLTVLFFQHNRTIYDVISNSTVVVTGAGRLRQQANQHRQH